MSDRRLTFTGEGWKQYQSWRGDGQTLKRVNRLIEAALRDPRKGLGKPEQLKENLSGLWSRRIDAVNRLVYAICESSLVIVSCRFHYD